ncbi:hypothetical protein D3C86_2260200 [compost metagenome]
MAWKICTGTSPMPGTDLPCMKLAKASRKPKSRQANMTGTGFHFAKISAASAI